MPAEHTRGKRVVRECRGQEISFSRLHMAFRAAPYPLFSADPLVLILLHLVEAKLVARGRFTFKMFPEETSGRCRDGRYKCLPINQLL